MIADTGVRDELSASSRHSHGTSASARRTARQIGFIETYQAGRSEGPTPSVAHRSLTRVAARAGAALGTATTTSITRRRSSTDRDS
jgi:hypothetical protein